jgi:hypothetical protein
LLPYSLSLYITFSRVNFPTTPLYFSGGSTVTPLNAILIGDIINISGGTHLSSDYSSIGGSPIKSDALYE